MSNYELTPEEQALSDQITSVLYRSNCPSGTDLNLYVAGLMPEEQSANVDEHLEECPLCPQDIEQIEEVLDMFYSFPLFPE